MKTKLFQICLTIIDLLNSDLNKTVLNLIDKKSAVSFLSQKVLNPLITFEIYS